MRGKFLRKVTLINTNQKGATATELAIVLFLFLFLVIGVIDFSRILAIKGMLSYSTQRALRQASQDQNLTLDGRTCSEIVGALSCVEAVQTANAAILNNSVNSVLNEAKDLPLRTLLHDIGSAEETKLTQVQLVRPGEADYPTQTNCYDSSADVILNGFTNLMEECPLMVTMSAEVEPFLPFLNTVSLQSTSFGFAEFLQYGQPPTFPKPTPAGGSNGGSSGSSPEICPNPDCSAGSSDILCCSDYSSQVSCNWNEDTCLCDCSSGFQE